MRGYFNAAKGAAYLPQSKEETRLVLNTLLREKAFRKLLHDLTFRPEWVMLTLRGLSAPLA